ncbi:hypothetical protein [Xanthobacter agilis]|uniref:Uncharacterized protein n=1 Tax=Xanthobacter agilis TaxID=47492 RepID=A0ABU0LA74_XANAG|nr:hypothetical protein [Xanthobacter agilis]MDQ0504042.1 hypothetical protein [Xanthobacter agilis]
MASHKGDVPLPVRFVPGTAVRVRPPWQTTAKAVARSRAGIRLVASNTPDCKDETKD